MQEKSMNITPDFVIDILLRRRWYLIIPFVLCMVAGIFFSLWAPKLYKASTLILIEPQRVPENFVQSIVNIDMSARVQQISQQVRSRTNIERIIRDFDLFSDNADMFIEDKIKKIREQIVVEVAHVRSGLRRGGEVVTSFSISYQSENPEKTMNIANALSSYLINEDLKTRESQAVGTSEFLNDELNATRSRLMEVEGRIETYKKKHLGELPEQLESNLSMLERLQEQLSDRLQNIREGRNRLTVLDQVIATPAPVTQTSGTDQSTFGESSDLNVLKEQLSVLTNKYTDRHPDVVKVKKMIAELERQQSIHVGSTDDAPSSQTATRPNFRDENYRQRQETKLSVDRMEVEAAELRRDIAFYKNRIEATPQREQELASLQRDYLNIQNSYNSLLERKLEADIAVNMEREQKGAQFEVLDSAALPQRPISPDMRKLFILFFAAGIGIGGGIIFILEFLDTSFRRTEDVEALDVSILATIPVIRSRKDVILKRVNQALSIVSVLISVVLFFGFALLSLLGEETVMEFVNGFVQV